MRVASVTLKSRSGADIERALAGFFLVRDDKRRKEQGDIPFVSFCFEERRRRKHTIESFA
jgi:hypothetical protein